jgi:hypothetical protein
LFAKTKTSSWTISVSSLPEHRVNRQSWVSAIAKRWQTDGKPGVGVSGAAEDLDINRPGDRPGEMTDNVMWPLPTSYYHRAVGVGDM